MVKMIVEDKVIIDALERAYYWTCIKSAETAIGRTKLFYRLQYSRDNDTPLAYAIKRNLNNDTMYYFDTKEEADKFYADFGKA